MDRCFRAAAGLLVWVGLFVPVPVAGQAQGVSSVRRVRVLGQQNPVEIEIEASDRLVPQTQVLTGPDRLVVDFANAVPGAQLRNQLLNRGEVKSVRVSLFSAKPPVTRVVFDLKSPQHYQVFPSGRTVMVKVGAGMSVQSARLTSAAGSPGSGAGLVNTSYPAQSVPVVVPAPAPAPPPLVVSFQAGLLTISSNKASLSEVLFAVHQRTGAEIAIPAGAEQEQVMAEIGPAPAPEVLAHLLNGSKFNFLILSSASDPSVLDRVILSARPEGPAPAYRPLPQMQPVEEPNAEPSEPPPPPPAAAEPAPPPGPQAPPPGPPETKPAGNDAPD